MWVRHKVLLQKEHNQLYFLITHCLKLATDNDLKINL